MEKTQREVSPWLAFDPLCSYATAAGAHEWVDVRSPTEMRDVRAMVVVQDCNIGGAYLRIIAWKNSKKSYFGTLSLKEWFGEGPFVKAKDGDLVTMATTGHTFRVTDPHRNRYTKTLVMVANGDDPDKKK